MTKQDFPTFIKGPRVVPPIDFEEIERIHKEWERYDLDGRYRVTPNDPKGPKLKFKHGCTLTIRSSRESNLDPHPTLSVTSED